MAKSNKKKKAENNALKSAKDLKNYLNDIKTHLNDETVAPVYALSAINHALTLENIYDLLDQDNKEIARDIWLNLKNAGLQLENPPVLFD